MVWESRKMVELEKKKNLVQSILHYEFFNQRSTWTVENLTKY